MHVLVCIRSNVQQLFQLAQGTSLVCVHMYSYLVMEAGNVAGGGGVQLLAPTPILHGCALSLSKWLRQFLQFSCFVDCFSLLHAAAGCFCYCDPPLMVNDDLPAHTAAYCYYSQGNEPSVVRNERPPGHLQKIPSDASGADSHVGPKLGQLGGGGGVACHSGAYQMLVSLLAISDRLLLNSVVVAADTWCLLLLQMQEDTATQTSKTTNLPPFLLSTYILIKAVQLSDSIIKCTFCNVAAPATSELERLAL